MTDAQLPFGIVLRRWRERRRMTQADLAHAAESSTRHLSCLETGRARPSREMVLRLAEELAVPLREQNDLLLAAGFAPAFRERAYEDLGAARLAIDRILDAHRPYPAFAVDRHWTVVASNGAAPQIYEGCSPALLEAPLNSARLVLHPQGLGPQVVNYAQWREHTVALLRRQLEMAADPVIAALLAEIEAYPTPDGAQETAPRDEGQPYAAPLRLRTRLGVVSFLSTNMVFGTPTDVTLAELSLEMLFPADEATSGILRAFAREEEAATG